MPLDPIGEADLFTALRPFRVEPDVFLAAVQARLRTAESEAESSAPLEDSQDSPFLRMAAAFLPLPLLSSGKATLSAAKMAPLAGKYKLLGYVALPAISLFFLLGSALFGTFYIRQVQKENVPDDLGPAEMIEAGNQWWDQWWSKHKGFLLLLWSAVLLLPMFGYSWVLFLLLLVSMGVVLFMLAALAKQGLGNRLLVGQSCLMGLVMLAQAMMVSGMGDESIHFFDQKLLSVVCYLGVFILALLTYDLFVAQRGQQTARTGFAFLALLLVGLCCWFVKPTVFPLTSAKIQRKVESFEKAPYDSVTWRSWEKVAHWTQQAGLRADFSKPRQLLDQEIASEQHPFILGSAFRVGIIDVEQIAQLKGFESKYQSLLDGMQRNRRKPQKILSIDFEDWVIRAAVMQELLTDDQRDYLEKRLLATWEALVEYPYLELEDALRISQLLEVIGRPLDRDRTRTQVHDWLRQFHSKSGGGFKLAGGFKGHLAFSTGDLETTWYAIELMRLYGIPDHFDMNWVRSFLKPQSMRRHGDRAYLAAVTRDNMQHLPGIHQPGWLEFAYYERNFIAAILLIALCIYATVSSPVAAVLPEKKATR